MKKGFTLVELLAVILIIGILATFSTVSVITAQREMKNKMYCEKIDLMLKNAVSYGDKSSAITAGNCYHKKTINALLGEGVFTPDEDGKITSPIDGADMGENWIGIYIKNRRAYTFYNETDATKQQNYLELCQVPSATDRPTTECP